MLNDRNKNFSHLVNKLFMCARVSLFAVHCNSYSDSRYHSLQFGYTFRMGLYYNKSVKDIKMTTNLSLIPKRDPRITNFSIPGPGIENSIPGLQSLVINTIYFDGL